ncbi:Uncharacterised protein [Cytobacillus firmus]|nr:Uncharacterised protein [Cytobacillus firmus]
MEIYQASMKDLEGVSALFNVYIVYFTNKHPVWKQQPFTKKNV